MGSVSGMARYAKEQGRPLFVLWLDAHADFNSPATSPSGNMHGMPVAFFCGQAEFTPILDKDRPMVDPKNVFQVGIRSVDDREREEIAAHGVNVYDMRAIDETGMAHIMHEIIATIKAANGLLHVSLDVDFLDPELAPGVGTTVPGGATFREAHLIMEMLWRQRPRLLAGPGRAQPLSRRPGQERPHPCRTDSQPVRPPHP